MYFHVSHVLLAIYYSDLPGRITVCACNFRALKWSTDDPEGIDLSKRLSSLGTLIRHNLESTSFAWFPRKSLAPSDCTDIGKS